MHNLPESPFANPVWNALQTTHRHFAVCAGNACRYPADVAPFAAVAEASWDALRRVHSLLTPGESVWVADIGIGDLYRRAPDISTGLSRELSLEQALNCLQMILPDDVAVPDSQSDESFDLTAGKPSDSAVSDSGISDSTTSDATMKLVRLSRENAAEMVALTDVAFPGFFRARTCEMGSYYGVRSGEELVAMAGERLKLDAGTERYSELSGICTHPAYRGKGLAARLMWRLVRDHRRDGIVSWLHVGSENRRAVELYERMGFMIVREVVLLKLTRKG
jgi:ribosomal protein S18 acetylase RimI-like enzyme